MRTPLTYYGGKQRLAAAITALIPAHRVYLEPFAGGAAVLFHKPRAERETLNDLDGHVMGFWRALREHPDELARAVALTPYSRREWRGCYGRQTAGDDVETARRFLVEIDQSYSREGTGWSPPSVALERRGRWQPGVCANLPDKLTAAAQRLTGVALEHTDALELIAHYDHPDAVIYCDPPVRGDRAPGPRKSYRHDDHDGALWDRLVAVLQTIEHAAVILSRYPCPQAQALGWPRVELGHHRSVQARAGGTLTAAPEGVWLSPAVPQPLGCLLTQPASGGGEEVSAP